jgi:hypothetical protein
MFAGKGRAYEKVNHLSDAPLYGVLLAIPTKIRLGKKVI